MSNANMPGIMGLHAAMHSNQLEGNFRPSKAIAFYSLADNHGDMQGSTMIAIKL
jgi:hypothetical protein